jgi:hypothetical protein
MALGAGFSFVSPTPHRLRPSPILLRQFIPTAAGLGSRAAFVRRRARNQPEKRDDRLPLAGGPIRSPSRRPGKSFFWTRVLSVTSLTPAQTSPCRLRPQIRGDFLCECCLRLSPPRSWLASRSRLPFCRSRAPGPARSALAFCRWFFEQAAAPVQALDFLGGSRIRVTTSTS